MALGGLFFCFQTLMRGRWLWLLLLFFGLEAHAQNAAPEKPKITRILFLLDASGSMLAPWEGHSRWDVAKRMLGKMADSLNAYPNLELGLRVYGHQFPNSEKNCEDSRLEVPSDAVQALASSGDDPTLEALSGRYATVRRFLPALLAGVAFEGTLRCQTAT